MMAAIQAAALIPDAELRARVQQIAKKDPDLNVRQVALKALDAMDASRYGHPVGEP
jgi:hypothetical protein